MVYKLSAQTQNSRRFVSQKTQSPAGASNPTGGGSGHVATVIQYRQRSGPPRDKSKNPRSHPAAAAGHRQPEHQNRQVKIIFQRMANDSHYLIGTSVAREQRLRWEALLADESARIVVNMSEIKQISKDYAAECFGKLSKHRERIKLVCCEEHHRRRIESAFIPLQ